MNSLPFETYCHIASYLEPLEEYLFSRTCRNLHAKFCKGLFFKINNRLATIFGDKLPDLKKVMAETGSVISGSFIMQCLLGENWKSDIDFYVPYQNNVITIGPMMTYEKSKLDDFMYETMLYNGYGSAGYENFGNNKIKWVRDYAHKRESVYDMQCEKLEVTIQIICVDIDKSLDLMRDHVIKTFDFDICKCMFYNDQKDKLYVYDLENMFLRRTEFRVSSLNKEKIDGYNILSSVQRHKKYVKRGFQFTNKIDTNMLDKIKLSYDSYMFLKNKYIARPIIAAYHTCGDIADESDLYENLHDVRCGTRCYVGNFGIGKHYHLVKFGSLHEFVIVV